jgi:hypothetical protein
MRPGHLGGRAIRSCRLHHKALVLFPAPAQPALHPRVTSIEFSVLGIRSPYAQHFRMITGSQTRAALPGDEGFAIAIGPTARDVLAGASLRGPWTHSA